jgi:hypothetical protein
LRQLTLLWNAFLTSNANKRHDARYRLAKTLTYRLGFRILNPNVSWFRELEPLAALWRETAQTKDYLSERHYVVHSMAKSVANLPGDSAECGVYYGASSFMICLATEGKPGACHHVFDSFEGLSRPEAVDVPSDGRAYAWQEGDLAVSIETVSANLRRFDFVKYHKGWIPSQFGVVADRRFALVHIDVDLYQPTRDSLAFFYERTVPGGVILCDDYGSINCPGATKAFDEFLADKPEKSVIQLTTGQGLIVKRQP